MPCSPGITGIKESGWDCCRCRAPLSGRQKQLTKGTPHGVPFSFETPSEAAGAGQPSPGYRITSNADDGTLARVAKSSSLQRESGAPLTYQPEPLSASNIPCFIIARRITRMVGENDVVSKLDLRRTRIPIGGNALLVSLLA